MAVPSVNVPTNLVSSREILMELHFVKSFAGVSSPSRTSRTSTKSGTLGIPWAEVLPELLEDCWIVLLVLGGCWVGSLVVSLGGSWGKACWTGGCWGWAWRTGLVSGLMTGVVVGVVCGVGRSRSLASRISLLLCALVRCDEYLPLTNLLEGEEIDGEVLRLRSADVIVFAGRGKGDICSTPRILFSKELSESLNNGPLNLALPLSGGSLTGGPGFL